MRMKQYSLSSWAAASAQWKASFPQALARPPKSETKVLKDVPKRPRKIVSPVQPPKSQQFTFGVFREGFFANIFLINVSPRIFCSGCCFKWRHASWLQAHCKVSWRLNPKYRSALSGTSKTILTRSVRGSMCGLLRASGRAFAVRVFTQKKFRTFRRISAKFLQNFRNLRWRSTNDFWTKFPQKFPQNFRNFSRCSLQWVGGGVIVCRWVCRSTQLQRGDWMVTLSSYLKPGAVIPQWLNRRLMWQEEMQCEAAINVAAKKLRCTNVLWHNFRNDPFPNDPKANRWKNHSPALFHSFASAASTTWPRWEKLFLERRRTRTMTKLCSKKVCYTYGHGHLKTLLHTRCRRNSVASDFFHFFLFLPCSSVFFRFLPFPFFSFFAVFFQVPFFFPFSVFFPFSSSQKKKQGDTVRETPFAKPRAFLLFPKRSLDKRAASQRRKIHPPPNPPKIKKFIWTTLKGGEANASKRKQMDKRKQTLTPPFIAVFLHPPWQSP